MLRVFASARYRLAVATVLGAAALLRLAVLVSESYSNMDDFRRFIVVPARLAWRGVSPYHRIGVALPREDLGNIGTFLTPPLLVLLLPWTRLADDPGRALWISVEIVAIAVTLAAVYAGIGRPTPTEALVAIF
ncbi:MAG TPA: hypothetical protein VNV65_13095, partial [Candidatus Solibacter sp.]|nr:hypothetical protein [Candidatus Solibacter sp.]